MSSTAWILICIAGIIINFGMLMHEAEKQPEGAMGMGIFFLFAFIPWAFPVLYGITTVAGWFGLGK